MNGRPWLLYSVKKDAAFCKSCLCFGSNYKACIIRAPNETPFASTGFKNWKKAVGQKESYLDQHTRSEGHQLAEEKAVNFLKTREPGKDVTSILQKQLAAQQVRMKEGILSIIDIVIALGQRGIAFRGNWAQSAKAEDGNFSFFVDWKSKYDQKLEEHLKHAPENAKYTSPYIQNEIITLCEHLIREKIKSEIPKYWSIMADETQDCSTSEQVSLCVRFVDSKDEVREEFLGFVKIKKMDAETIANSITSALKSWDLDMDSLVGQGYDGASVMSSSKNGVQAKIAAQYPNAVYVHCRSHVLNLAIASGCKNVPSIRNLFDDVSKLTWFLGGSAKRKELFLDAAANQSSEEVDHLLAEGDGGELDECEKALQEGSRRTTVPKFCPTRWTARVSTLSALMAKYATVLEAMESISLTSTGDAHSDARSYVRLLEDPQFIATLAVAQAILSYLAPVTKSLQAKNCNLAAAYKDVALARECIRGARNDHSWSRVWSKIEKLARSVDVTMTKPRTTRVQRHRANAGPEDQPPSDYYKINVYFPFIDHVISELETRFSDEHEGLLAAQNLIPVNLPQLTNSHVDAIETYYGTFLTFVEKVSLRPEVGKWKKIYEHVPQENKPSSANLALNECSPQMFPALHKILVILLTTPVGSVSCERSFSALRLLKLWTRSSMTEERLSGLAMLKIHRGTSFVPKPEEVYSRKANWRQLTN